MTSRSSRIDQPTLDLISTIAETQRASISAKALSTYFAAAGRQLLAAGLLVRNGDDTMTTSLVDHDDEPVPLIWSPNDGSHGYFSNAAGWVKVAPQQTALFRLDMMAVIARLTAQFDLVARHGPIMLSPDLLWEIGDVRLGRRAERMPVWFARRLADEAVATKVSEVAKSRPVPRTRIVLTTTPSRLIKLASVPGQVVVNFRDLIDFNDGLAVHPEMLGARLDGAHPSDPTEVLNLSPDGKRLSILGGEPVSFKTDIQIKIIRALVAGHKEGRRYSAEELLTAAGSGSGSLRRTFGNAKWAHLESYLKSNNGLWGFEF